MSTNIQDLQNQSMNLQENEENDEDIQALLNQIGHQQPGAVPPQHVQQPIKDYNPTPSITHVPAQMTQHFTQPNDFRNLNSNFITSMRSDMKLIVVILVTSFVINFIPIENFFAKYISLDKIPYGSLIVKAILIAFGSILIYKFV